MKRQDIFDAVTMIYNACELNFVKEEVAIRPELAGLKLFEEPIMKIGSVEDGLFEKYNTPEKMAKIMEAYVEPTIEYSTKEATNKDVIATVNVTEGTVMEVVDDDIVEKT